MMIMVQKSNVVVMMLLIQIVRSFECRSTIEFTNVGCEIGCGDSRPGDYNGCVFYSERQKRCLSSEGRCIVSEDPNECDLQCFFLLSSYDDSISDANPTGDVVKTLVIDVPITRYETLGQLKLPVDLTGFTINGFTQDITIQPNTFEQNLERFRHLSIAFVPNIDVQYLPPTLESLSIKQGTNHTFDKLPPNLKRLAIYNDASEQTSQTSPLLQAPALKLDSLILLHGYDDDDYTAARWEPPRGILPVLRHLKLGKTFKTVPKRVFDIPSLEIM